MQETTKQQSHQRNTSSTETQPREMKTNWQNASAQNQTGNASSNFEMFIGQILYSMAACTVISFLGNTLVILIVCRNKKMRTTPNLLIVNMAVANILRSSSLMAFVILLFYMRIDLSTANKLLQAKLWKLFACFAKVSYNVVIASLTVVSVYRFCAVVFPIKARHRIKKNCLIVIWVLTLTESSPIMFDLSSTQTYLYNVVDEVLTLVLPCFVMFCLYSTIIINLWRQKIPGDPSIILIRKRRKQNITLTAMFINLLILFCLTNGTAYILAWLYPTETEPTNTAVIRETLLLVYQVTNPFIFFIYCRNYRQGLKELFNCCHKISTAQTRTNTKQDVLAMQ